MQLASLTPHPSNDFASLIPFNIEILGLQRLRHSLFSHSSYSPVGENKRNAQIMHSTNWREVFHNIAKAQMQLEFTGKWVGRD